MIKSSYLSYLLTLIKTKQYADEILVRIDELKDCLYNKRIDLDEKMVKEISAWFIENYGKNVLVDLVSDKSLIGGAIVEFNQSSKDFSLKKRLEDISKQEDWQIFITRGSR